MSWASEAVCFACACGLPDECTNPQPIDGDDAHFIPCSARFTDDDKPREKHGTRGRPVAGPRDLGDDTSAGRKRAAMLAPIMTGMRCEWAGLKHAGGGVVPILGCRDNTIAETKTTEEAHDLGADEVGHRHHGPDKAVINNAVGRNLHRVCSVCHNRWHAANDSAYPPVRGAVDKQFVPLEAYYAHDDLTVFTGEEYDLAEAWWALPVAARGPFPFEPTARKILPARVDTNFIEPLELDPADPFA
jgi:hypothetical protein